MDSTSEQIGRVLLVAVGAAIAAFVGWVLFVEGPRGNLATLFGIVLAVLAAIAGARFAGNFASRLFPAYNVAEVGVEGPIVRRSGGVVPNRPTGTPADDIVEQIEAADEDDNAEALIVHLNTPGGEVVPSDDIRRAAESFDGPTIAYATDTCASGGYWIASGCDRIYAREGSIVGSIGVIASRVTAAELMDKVGLTYERLVAGRYKDAGVSLRDMDEREREYLQGIVDEYYATFLERVTEGRDLDAEEVAETEARVYLGDEALDLGLVDELGTRDDIEAHLEDELSTPVEVREFQPTRSLRERLGGVGATVAYAFGAGITAAMTKDEGGSTVPTLRLR